jgi:hypothetical protein
MQVWIRGFKGNKLLIRRWRWCNIILTLIYNLPNFLFFNWLFLITFRFKYILFWWLILFIWYYLFKNHFLLLQITCHSFKFFLRYSFLFIVFFWITTIRLTPCIKPKILCFLSVINSNWSRRNEVFIKDLIRFCFKLSLAYRILFWTTFWTIFNLAILFIHDILLPSYNWWSDIGTIINIFSQISSFLYCIKKLLAFKPLTTWNSLSYYLLISQPCTKSNLL